MTRDPVQELIKRAAERRRITLRDGTDAILIGVRATARKAKVLVGGRFQFVPINEIAKIHKFQPREES